jgi:uncharacterized protein YjbI with pentapeptide repeats
VLIGADFRGALLKGADFTGAEIFRCLFDPEGAEDAKLSTEQKRGIAIREGGAHGNIR